MDFKTVTEWFYNNYTIINSYRCSYLCLGKNNYDSTLSFNELNLKNSEEEIILGKKVKIKLKWALRTIDDDQQSSFQDLICKYKDTIHQRIFRTHIVEICKITINYYSTNYELSFSLLCNRT